MARPVDLADPLLELISHLAPELKRRVRASFDEISKNPGCGKSLKEELEGYRSYKLGQWSVIYKERPHFIEIAAIGPRRTIYQKVALEIKKHV